ncbi:MAG: carboxypeptidase-like regulatory domain-containing protein, partial [Planctomycetota bacterium]
MRQSVVVVLLLTALVAAAGLLLVPDLFSGDDLPITRWNEADEIVVEARDSEAEVATSESFAADTQRQEVEVDSLSNEERTELTLRGRVVDRFRGPVADAKVWLDFGRGGQRGRGDRARRVPEPVQTDSDGRFAFQGQTFRNLRVSLLVVHGKHAPTQFERNLGEVGSELDLGELVVTDGGELIGRVTDLGGNGIAAAEVRLQPDNDNWMRFQRDRDALLPAQATDNNGYYRFVHVTGGDWRVSATAKHYENGTSESATAIDGQRTEVQDILLGPGFELAGIVMDRAGQPIADAEVQARPRRQQNENGGGRGGRGGRGGPAGGPGGGGPGNNNNDYRTKSDAQGRFLLEHLPDALVDLTAQKKGYLDARLDSLDPEQTQPVYLTMEDGLQIRGTVMDAVANAAVLRFAVRAQWRRSLPVDAGVEADMQALMQQMRDGALDETARAQLRDRMQTLRGQMRGQGGGAMFGPGGGGGPGGRGGRDANTIQEDHPGGVFVATGLQEGIYTVIVESESHAVYRSEDVEVRLGAPAP